MSRKVWIILIASVLALGALGAAGLAALILVPRYQAGQRLIEARALVAEGKYYEARRPYSYYLLKNGDDIAVTEEYVEVCKKITRDRRRALAAGGRGLENIIEHDPANPKRVQDVLDYYRAYRLWSELESQIELVAGRDLATMDFQLAYDLCVAVHEQGRARDLIEMFETMVARGGDLRDLPLRVARIQRQLGNVNEADGVIPPLLEKDPESVSLKICQAAYLVDQNLLEDAASVLAQVPEAERGRSDYHLAAMRLANARGDAPSALTVAEAAIAAHPADPDIQLNFLVALERVGDRERAAKFIEEMDPVARVDSPSFLLFLVELRLDSGDPDGAEQARDWYAEAYPDHGAMSRYLNGRILFAREKIREAREQFAIAAEMNPNLHRASYFLAMCDLELGNPSAARVPLEQYLRNNPGDAQAQRIWDANFEAKASVSVLKARANRLLTTDRPDVADLLYTVEDLLQNRSDEAQSLSLSLLEKARTLDPGDARVYTALAGYHLDRGDIDSAESVLAAAAEAGLPESKFPLIRTSIFLLRGDLTGAMATAQAHLEKSTYREAREWARFFTSQGYFREGDQLLERFGSEGDGVIGDLAYRMSMAVQNGRLEEARERYVEAEGRYGRDPESADTLNEMRLALAEGLVVYSPETPAEEVERLASVVRETDPESAGLKILEARIEMRKPLPDYGKVEDLMLTIAPDSTYYLPALQIRAEVLLTRGMYSEAEALARESLSGAPNNVATLHLLADALLGQQNTGEAVETLERVLELDHRNLRALRVLVRLYNGLAQPARAEESLARLEAFGKGRPGHEAQVAELRALLNPTGSSPAAAPPDSVETLSYAGLTEKVTQLISERRHDEALALVDGFVQRNPNEAEPLVLLGRIYLERGAKGDPQLASSAFTRAEVIVPRLKPALMGKSKALLLSGDLVPAVSILESLLRDGDQDVTVMYELALCLATDPTRLPDALAWIDRAIAIDDMAEFIRLRSHLLTRMNRPDEAIAAMDALIGRTGKSSAEDELILAEAYLVKGDRPRVEERLDSAATLVPEGDSRLETRLRQLRERLNAMENQ